MVLNYIWIGFFLIAFVIAVFKLLVFGDYDVFPAMMDSTFSSSKTAFEISLGLTGVLSLLFVTLVYLSDFAYWIVAGVLAKMAVSMLLSHFEISQIFKENSIRPKFFKITKVDAAVNVLMGLGVAVIAVS